MSKNKPKETIEYVIRLQDKERQMVESAIGAYQVNRIMTPIVTLLNDVTGMATLLGLLALLPGFVFYAEEGMSSAELIDAFTTQREQAIAAGVITVGTFGLGPGLGKRIAELLGLFEDLS